MYLKSIIIDFSAEFATIEHLLLFINSYTINMHIQYLHSYALYTLFTFTQPWFWFTDLV